MKRTALALLLMFAFCLVSNAQDKGQRPSPPAQAQCKLSDGKTITVDYSSPRMKGRKVFGDLVPYGQVWRTGANEATKFVTTAALSVEGKDVPAGSYTIFTVPAQDKWTLIINKHTWPACLCHSRVRRLRLRISPSHLIKQGMPVLCS